MTRWPVRHGPPRRAATPRVGAGVKERNEMTIGRTDDPENPSLAPAFEAASLFGAGPRYPSGPADMLPRQQAGHMNAIDHPSCSFFLLHSRGRPHMRAKRRCAWHGHWIGGESPSRGALVATASR